MRIQMSILDVITNADSSGPTEITLEVGNRYERVFSNISACTASNLETCAKSAIPPAKPTIALAMETVLIAEDHCNGDGNGYKRRASEHCDGGRGHGRRETAHGRNQRAFSAHLALNEFDGTRCHYV